MSSLIALASAAQIVLGISFLIFVHELGHFLVARWNGVRCELFSIGFGPRIVGWRPGETEYRLSWIPLGGYVMMAGEDPNHGSTGAPDELASKSVLARMAIFSAGVAMNCAFAIVLFAIAFGIGVRFVEPRVGAIAPGSPAWHAGLLEGDRIARLDGHEIVNFDQIGLNVAFADTEAGVELDIERGAERLRRRVHPVYDEDQGSQWIGVTPASRKEVVVKRDGAAWNAGLRSGDRIARIGLAVDIDGTGKLLDALRQVEGDEFDVEYLREGQRHTGRIKALAGDAYLMGVVHGAVRVEAVRRNAPVDGVSPSAASVVGIQPGDRLFACGGARVHGVTGLLDRLEAWDAAWGESVGLEVLRDGAPAPVELQLPRDRAREAVLDLAVVAGEPTVGDVVAGSPAARAGIVPGSRITAIGGEAVSTWTAMAERVAKAAGAPLEVSWTDPSGEAKTQAIAAAKVARLEGSIGLGFDFELSPEVRHGFLGSCRIGYEHSREMGYKVVLMVKALFTRQVSASKLGGPILIAQASWAYIERFGFGRFLYFLGLLSMNLVVLNLLPVPGLDGGHLLFLALEGLRGGPLPRTLMAVTQYVGLFAILALIVFVIFNDILRLMS